MLQAKKYGTGEKGHKSHTLNSIMKIINKNKTIKTILINPLRTKGEATRKNSINMVKKYKVIYISFYHTVRKMY